MLQSVLRPVSLPGSFIGQPAPCDFFDAQGRLLLRSGAHISEKTCRASAVKGKRRLFCDSVSAHKIWPVDPIGQIRQVIRALHNLEQRVVAGDYPPPAVFYGLVKTLYQNWCLDADACIGYMRVVRSGYPAVEHVVLSAFFAAELASQSGMGSQDIGCVMGAALTMNLGSLALHTQLHQCCHALDDDQRAALRAHPARAAALLTQIGDFPQAWREAVLQHHENLDGSGYPLQLQRSAISVFGRILRVADILTARLQGRRSRSPQYWNLRKASSLAQLVEHVFGDDLGSSIDISLARMLMSRLGIFSPGSIVRLNNGEFAVISRRGQTPESMPYEAISFACGGQKSTAIRPRMRRIGTRAYRIQGYAHDDLPRLPACDWSSIWGYQSSDAKAKQQVAAATKKVLGGVIKMRRGARSNPQKIARLASAQYG